MTLRVTPLMLMTLTGGKFTELACEAICRYYEECTPEDAPYIGDIMILFSEIDTEDIEETDCVLEELNNGKTVIFM